MAATTGFGIVLLLRKYLVGSQLPAKIQNEMGFVFHHRRHCHILVAS